jgi:tetratricopeptide (TPR) repeat protein
MVNGLFTRENGFSDFPRKLIHIYGDAECNEFLHTAAEHLKKAIEIFSPHASDEPIRLIEAYNELGCVYREQATRTDIVDSARPQTPADDMAIQNLQEAIAQAQEKKYWVQYVDSYEDLAQVYFQARHLDKAEECLDRAEEAVPDIYKIKVGAGLQAIPPEDCSEEFWRQMGKIELLRGHLAFDREQTSSSEASRSLLNQTVQHYALAAGYFERYSGQIRFQFAVEQLYDHFKRHNRADLEYAQNELLPAIAAKYHLDLDCLHEFFKDTLGLALQLAR